ncbi:hypothetical protein AB0G73_01230 [Streptomyces sp. NPDC020719]|uniref:hypothetical protein n=1 Tax=unclassified Streptomyces TaxID=2593676 RepID=UPI0034108DAB
MSISRPMPLPGPRPSRSRRARAAVVAAAIAAALTLAGCQDGTDPKSPPPPVSSSAAPTATPSDSLGHSPAPSPTSAKPHTPAPAPTKSHTAEPPAPDNRPSAKDTASTHSGDCEIVSNAGNCYNAGQFCRKADLGRSTHAANGREIYCRVVSGRPHWQY